MSDILKKPIHIALLKATHVADLAKKGVFKQSPFGKDPSSDKQPLPEVEKAAMQKMEFPKMEALGLAKQQQKRIKLRVIHESIPPIPKDKQPPCHTCRTSACCVAFIVGLSELEYESGLYGDAAVKLTPEMYEQLNSKLLLPIKMLSPRPSPRDPDATQFVLEGMIGEPCPFLQADKRCGIYDSRPAVCRTYTCVGDDRITEEMRQGTAPIGLPIKKVK